MVIRRTSQRADRPPRVSACSKHASSYESTVGPQHLTAACSRTGTGVQKEAPLSFKVQIRKTTTLTNQNEKESIDQLPACYMAEWMETRPLNPLWALWSASWILSHGFICSWAHLCNSDIHQALVQWNAQVRLRMFLLASSTLNTALEVGARVKRKETKASWLNRKK